MLGIPLMGNPLPSPPRAISLYLIGRITRMIEKI